MRIRAQPNKPQALVLLCRLRRRKLFRAALGVAVGYSLLWVLTLAIGVPQLRQAATTRLRAQLSNLRPGAVIHECPPGAACPHPNYWVAASTPIPLVIRVRYGSEVAPLAGSGATEWWFWVLGRSVLFATSWEWIS